MEMQISNRSNLVVAADDFGMNERANRNILFLVSMGKIDRVAIMPNGHISEKEILELIKSGIKLDIHLDLTSLENDHENIPGIHSRIGKFILGYLTGKYTKKKVAADWKAQIEKFKELFGKYPDGINSHEHVHFFPPFFKIIMELQKEYPIPYLRFGTDNIISKQKNIGKVLSILRKINQKKFAASAFVSSNHLVSLDWIADLDSFLKKIEAGSTEIVCHPHRAEEFVLIKNNF